MGVMKTLCLGLTLVGAALPAQAVDDLTRHVSTCVGRYSAQMEHHWLFQDMPSDRIERERSHLIDILETLTTADNAVQVLSGRIDAKLAHASLLTRATFSGDPRLARWAARRAEQHMALCNDITLPRHDPQTAGLLPTSGTAAGVGSLPERPVPVRK